MSESESAETPPESFEVVQKEARAVIEAQLETLRSTDEKALSTVRLTALTLGLFVSAVSISDEPQHVINSWVIVGGSALFGAIIFGILSYAADRPSYGIGPGYIDTVLRDFSSREAVEVDLLDRYADWIDENSTEIATDSLYLSVAQGLLVLGLLLMAVGVWTLI